MKIVVTNNKKTQAINTDKGMVFAINKEDNSLSTIIAPTFTFEEGMQVILTGMLHYMEAFAKMKPEARPDIYDAANVMMSSMLEQFMPDHEMRPDLTAEAIKRAEDQIIDEEYNKLNRETRRKAKQAYNRKVKQTKKAMENNAKDKAV